MSSQRFNEDKRGRHSYRIHCDLTAFSWERNTILAMSEGAQAGPAEDAANYQELQGGAARQSILLGVAVLLFGAAVASLTQFVVGRSGPTPTLQERAAGLSRALADATKLIDEMGTEIQSRQAIVQKLQNDLNTYSALAALRKEEVEAVALTLRVELDREAGRSFWEGASLHFTFFVLGAGITWLVERRHGSKRDSAV
jgi:hypothetical protein